MEFPELEKECRQCLRCINSSSISQHGAWKYFFSISLLTPTIYDVSIRGFISLVRFPTETRFIISLTRTQTQLTSADCDIISLIMTIPSQLLCVQTAKTFILTFIACTPQSLFRFLKMPPKPFSVKASLNPLIPHSQSSLIIVPSLYIAFDMILAKDIFVICLSWKVIHSNKI